MNLGKKIFLIIAFSLTLLNLRCPWFNQKPISNIDCVEGGMPVQINFSKLQIYENSSFVYSYDMAKSAVIDHGDYCKVINISFADPVNPTTIYEIDLFWNSDKTAFKSASIYLSNTSSYPATIDGTLDTFTQIIGGPYKLVPLRCSTSIPVILNFSQLQIYQNAALSYTQATSTLTANEECGIVYIRNFDTASAVTGLNLYWDTGRTAIIDAWIYDTGSQIQSTIAAPASPVTPDTFTNVLGGTYQLVPVRP